MADLYSVSARKAPKHVPGTKRDDPKASSRAVLAVLVKDRAGVLCRVAELFSRRGYNIDSLTVGTSCEPGLSRMTIVTRGEDADIEQIMRQLDKLVEVVSVGRLAAGPSVYRELALVKVRAPEANKAVILRKAWDFEARVLDDSADCLTLEVISDKEGIDGIVAALEPFGILELARTGLSALGRGGLGLQARTARGAP